MNIVEHTHASADALAAALAASVADALHSAIAARGHAVLAVSGGNTPKRFFQALAQLPLAWPKIAVTLVDERWVAADNPRSNEALVREYLLHGAATAARFVPLFEAGAAQPEAALATVGARIVALGLPIDALVLGMGDDGHTASFFPGGDHLAEALDPNSHAIVLPMRASGAGEARITLTLPVVLAARALYLHIEGEKKRAVLQSALASDSQLPISAVLRNAHSPVQMFWCA